MATDAAPASAQPHLIVRLAELLRAATSSIDIGSKFRNHAEAALKEFDAKCYSDGEPLFMLRGRDELAGDSVRHWAAKACVRDVNLAKVTDALEISRRMEAFPNRRLPD